MSIEEIKAQLQGLPEIVDWPVLLTVIERSGSVPRPDWDLPLLACQAVGGVRAQGLPGAAAIACLQVSIILVDDILDDDPRGIHIRHGYGPTANLSLAFQSAAIRLLSSAPAEDRRLAAAVNCLAQAALATSVGQNLDVQNLEGEENYWKVVSAKSTPFYGGALKLGAILGGANSELAEKMHALGVIIGEIIQIEDDLEDALAVPANADWKQGRGNLLILFASTADHEDKQRFLDLIHRADEPQTLEQLQQILVKCGAVSYSAYQLVARYRAAMQRIEASDLANPRLLKDLLERYADSLISLLSISGVELTRQQVLNADLPT